MLRYLSDYHTHTYLSGDSQSTLLQNIRAAHRMGLHELCATEHWNLLDQQGNRLPTTYDFAPLLQQWRRLRNRWAGKVEVRIGIELGNSTVDTPAVEQGLQIPQLDFVIGSLHSASLDRGGIGIYTAAKNCRCRQDAVELLEDYVLQMEELVQAGTFDVLGHIIYPLRYLPPDYELTLEPWEERLTALMRQIVQAGKGIELNTTQGTTLTQWTWVLERYRQAGGEIITLGSDAHQPGYIGAGFQQALELLEYAGFRWLCTYRRRIPCFHRL